MHKDWCAKTKNAISMDATRTISKWLNEPTDAPLDRVALATVLARVGFLELETEALRNAFEATLERTAGIERWIGGALNNLQHVNAVGNHCLNSRHTHYSSEPYEKLGADKTGETTLGLLRRLEQEMRYAGWSEKQADNYERAELYAEVCEFLGDK